VVPENATTTNLQLRGRVTPMANNECKHCGGEVRWKNNVGHYRDFCRECAGEIADGRTTVRDMDDPPRRRDDDA
jgi:endogenous inhibitor of DNA gyrase (YacG/DUF329 family)